MRVVFFHRKPHAFHFSIEKVFAGIKDELSKKKDLSVESAVLPHFSRGILPRMKSALWSRRRQGDINHITGDVHFIALCLDSRRTILTIHDLNFLDHPNKIARLILRFFWLVLPLRNVIFLTVISQATKVDLLSRISFPPDRIRVIPNYRNELLAFTPRTFNQEKPVLLQIGTKANKNLPRLIEALRGIPCKLMVVGNNDLELEGQLTANRIDYQWTGRLSDAQLIDLFVSCDMLVYVSTSEGFGLPILEAQSLGRVVVTSHISSMPEVAGDGACLVDPYDVKSIRDGIRKVISDPAYRELLIAKGLENIERFSLSRVADMYYALYQEVCRENSQSRAKSERAVQR